MRIKGKVLKISLISFAAICALSIAFVLWHGDSSGKKWSSGFDLSLARPAFAQSGQMQTFPADEVGIACYVKTDKIPDFVRLEKLSPFKGVKEKGEDYVIGVVALGGVNPEAFPYVYINRDGWIIAYHHANSPSSLIINWGKYDGGPITTTTLQDSIAKICETLEFNYNELMKDMGFYHFKYPNAKKLLLAAKTGKSFTYTIPLDIEEIYECTAALTYWSGDRISIDNEVFVDDSGYFKVPDIYLTSGKHEVVGVGKYAFVFIY